MKWLKRAIRNWLREDIELKTASHTVAMDEDNQPFTLSVMNALNGKVIQVRTYQPNPRGSDWKNEYYIVPEGDKLTEAVALLLMAKNLEKA